MVSVRRSFLFLLVLGIGCLFYCGTPWAFHLIVFQPGITERKILLPNFRFVARKDRLKDTNCGVAIIARSDMIDFRTSIEFVPASCPCTSSLLGLFTDPQIVMSATHTYLYIRHNQSTIWIRGDVITNKSKKSKQCPVTGTIKTKIMSSKTKRDIIKTKIDMIHRENMVYRGSSISSKGGHLATSTEPNKIYTNMWLTVPKLTSKRATESEQFAGETPK